MNEYYENARGPTEEERARANEKIGKPLAEVFSEDDVLEIKDDGQPLPPPGMFLQELAPTITEAMLETGDGPGYIELDWVNKWPKTFELNGRTYRLMREQPMRGDARARARYVEC